MADQEQLERLTRSVDEWNQWRQDYPEIQPDLSNADLINTNLIIANLGGANLRGADLISTNLISANLRSTDLSETNLYNADLSEANLSSADLRRANLHGAKLSRANLHGADLSEVNLRNADLSEVNLRNADLSEANFSNANLISADLSNAYFSSTIFVGVDLSSMKGLETVLHYGRSIVDINSVTLPTDEHIRLPFLRGVGFSDTAIEYLPSIMASAAIEYYSLFIAYANPDETLARRLHRDLQNKGARCWMAPHDLRPGDYHHSRIDEAILLHEKVLLLLSEHAVNSSWVKHEVQVALAREIRQDCTVLFPLRLDQAVMHTSKDWAIRLHEDRHIGDFTGWQDDATYQRSLAMLLRHLKVTQLPPI
jgi:hypothetical protein